MLAESHGKSTLNRGGGKSEKTVKKGEVVFSLSWAYSQGGQKAARGTSCRKGEERRGHPNWVEANLGRSVPARENGKTKGRSLGGNYLSARNICIQKASEGQTVANCKTKPLGEETRVKRKYTRRRQVEVQPVEQKGTKRHAGLS